MARSLTLPGELDFIAKYAAGRKNLVELGVAYGGTSQRLRAEMAEDGLLTLVDAFVPAPIYWNTEKLPQPTYEAANEAINVVRNGEVRWLRERSDRASEGHLGGVDFLLIDADHTFEAVMADWNAWKDKVVHGGVVLFHDVGMFNGVTKAWELIRKDKEFSECGWFHSVRVLKKRFPGEITVDKPKLFVAIPSKSGSMWIQTADALRRLGEMAERVGIQIVPGLVYNDPYIQEARNAMANRFMQTDCTHLLFLDDDIVFDPKHVFQLLEADKGVIAGVYPTKKIEWDLVLELAKKFTTGRMLEHASCKSLLLFPPGETKVTGKDLQGPIEVMAAPTGFMMIRRDLLEKFREHYPFRYDNERYHLLDMTAFFETRFRPAPDTGRMRFCGEDVDFCIRVREMGEKIWAMPTMLLGHVGMHVHRGCPFCAVGEPIHGEPKP